MYYRTVTLAHVALLLHITVLVGKTLWYLEKSTQRFGHLNENLRNKYVISVLFVFLKPRLEESGIFSDAFVLPNKRSSVSGVIFSAQRCFQPPNLEKQTYFFSKHDTTPAPFIIYDGPEKHFTVNYTSASPQQRNVFPFFFCLIYHFIFPKRCHLHRGNPHEC